MGKVKLGLMSLMMVFAVSAMTMVISEKESFAASKRKNWAVWLEGKDCALYLWNGRSVSKIPSSKNAAFLDINKNGWVVWLEETASKFLKVYLYNGKSVQQIVSWDWNKINIDINSAIKMNDNGWMVWSELKEHKLKDLTEEETRKVCKEWGLSKDEIEEWRNGEENAAVAYPSIYLWNGKSVQKLADFACQPNINNNNWVVWYQWWHGNKFLHKYIWLWDGNSIRKVVDENKDKARDVSGLRYKLTGSSKVRIGIGGYPQLNDNGWISWTDKNCVYLWDGKLIRLLTAWWGSSMQINNNGMATWTLTKNEYEYIKKKIRKEYQKYIDKPGVFLWNGKTVQKLSDDGYYSSINDKNEIAWTDENGIYFWNGKSVKKIWDKAGVFDFNSNGWIVWSPMYIQGKNEDVDIFKIYVWDGKRVQKIREKAGNPRISK